MRKANPQRVGVKNRDIDVAGLPNSARRIRLASGRTLADVANEAGLNYRHIHQYETRGSGLGIARRYLLATALKVEIGDLMTPGKLFFRKLKDNPKPS
jgi:transcriptional regulator with XRE-family HTH domain